MGGDFNWRRVLFDTNIVSRWVDGDEEFSQPIKGMVRKLRKRKAHFYVSTVTVQELMIHAIRGTGERIIETFLVETFSMLELDRRAAQQAAKIGAAAPRERNAKQAERDLWQRDIAILGTACANELDAVVTANGKDFLPYRDHVSCEIYVVEPVPRRKGK